MKKIILHTICLISLFAWSKTSLACDPIQPTVLDTVSIDPVTGNIIVSWFKNPSPHTAYYVVYVYNPLSDPPWDAVDTVYGASNISTIINGYNTSGGNFIVAVSAVDSCGNPSFFSFGTAHNTMYLDIQYNSCKLESKLTWNKYKNWQFGVGGYNIWASEDGAPFKQIGLSVSDTTFIHLNVNPQKKICYKILAIDGSGTKSATSNFNCIFSSFPAEPQFSYIRYASVIGPSAVRLLFFVDVAADVKEYRIERRINGKWLEIRKISPSDFTINNFSITDSSAEPNNYSYEYRLRTINICDVQSGVSNTVKTMLLTVENNPLFMTNLLSWNDYIGFENGVGEYKIFRSTTSDPFKYAGSSNFLTTGFEDEITDFYTGTGAFCYYVMAVENGTNQYGKMDSCLSNIVCLEQPPFVYVPNAFTPFGLNPVFKPVFSFLSPTNYKLTIFNRWGQTIFETNDIQIGWNGSDKTGKILPEVYVYKLEYSSSFGQVVTKTGSVTVVR